MIKMTSKKEIPRFVHSFRNRIYDLKERAARMKIRTKLLLLIFLSAAGCLFLFRSLWLQKWNAWDLIISDFPIQLDIFPKPADDFFERMAEEALKYDFPESEDDTEAVRAIAPFFDLADEYTSMYLYGLTDGMFRTGVMPEIMDTPSFRTFFDIGFDLTYGSGEQRTSFPLKFKNGYGTVNTAFYHSSYFIFPYFIFCLIVCILLFLLIIIFFVSRKMKTVVMLKESILRMSSGDLKTPVLCSDRDELGILTQELDRLRITLDENFTQEQQLHKSNRELTAALSHDLRTPLTILKGYLEILRLNRQKEMQNEYIRRCLQKAGDIQEMTERIFEYALVYDHTADSINHAPLAETSLEYIVDSLKEHEDFLHLTGFQTSSDYPAVSCSSIQIMSEPGMLKRVFNNLFSNVIKYADKKETVVISADAGQYLTITLKNYVKTGHDEIESSQIGLKSVKKMMEFMDGSVAVNTEKRCFTAELKFPVICTSMCSRSIS